MKKSIQGFTLIELVIVLAIIGIVAAVGVNGYQRYKHKDLYEVEVNCK